MNLQRTEQSPAALAADAIVIGVHDDSPLEGPSSEVDQACDGLISKLLERRDLATGECQTTSILAPAGVQADQILVVGLGSRAKWGTGAAYRTAAAASMALSKKPRQHVAFYLGHDLSTLQQQNLVAGAMVGCHGNDLYRREKDRHPFAQLSVAGVSDAAVAAGSTIGAAVNLTRRLVNEPADVIYPESFANEAEQIGRQTGLSVEVWDKPRLQAERCGALLAVARGSSRDPRLVIVRHQAGGAKPTLALVGKGVTFDSGGLSLKPTDNMKTMKADMAGAATVLAVMQAIATLRLPINVTGYIGLTENMTGGDAYKLGDVLTARNGKTIEVLNTDAEGRLVLADTLCVAVDDGVERIIDLATLTGACVVALGLDVAGLMTNDQSWCDTIASAAADCGEQVWQLPMFELYDEQIKAAIADIRNTGEGRWGGAITAAKFLEQFVAGTPWTHIDIAGPSFAEKPKPWQEVGGTGCLVRTLVHLLASF